MTTNLSGSKRIVAILMLLKASDILDSFIEQAAVLSRNESDCVQDLAGTQRKGSEVRTAWKILRNSPIWLFDFAFKPHYRNSPDWRAMFRILYLPFRHLASSLPLFLQASTTNMREALHVELKLAAFLMADSGGILVA